MISYGNNKSEICLFICKNKKLKNQIWTRILAFRTFTDKSANSYFLNSSQFSLAGIIPLAAASSRRGHFRFDYRVNHKFLHLRAERILPTEWYKPVFSMQSASATECASCCFVSTVNHLSFFYKSLFLVQLELSSSCEAILQLLNHY